MVSLVSSECDKEKFLWDEIKNSKDIEDYRYYNRKYPNGIFTYIANKNIKQLRGSNNKTILLNQKPSWLKGYTFKYKYYGVGRANKHFKGKDYQENLARSRAKKELQDKLDRSNLSQNQIYEYLNLIQISKYIDTKNRVYILVYIDNYDL
jgi:hypothetical protein